VEGCLAEYLRLPQTSCYPMPAAMSFDEAAAVEPLSIGLYASDQAGALEDATIGILGCGPIGMSVLLACRAKNAARLYVTDKIDARLAAASKAGASWTGNPTTTDVVASIVEREPLQLDIVFECCGEQEALDQGIEFLKPGGKLILIGIPAVNRVSFDINKLRRKELCIQNTRRQNDTVQRAIDLISTGSVNVNPMITHHFDLDRTQEAFDLVADYGDGVVKAMICLG
jgi:L-iditol 2-dehydrogenase